ncbi:MAG: hypothetical protein LUG26_02945 [Ruminococcus sp.]|nr:hypothetical protein [Ruminococcus sp.]
MTYQSPCTAALCGSRFYGRRQAEFLGISVQGADITAPCGNALCKLPMPAESAYLRVSE